jgi:hypothetical protein
MKKTLLTFAALSCLCFAGCEEKKKVVVADPATENKGVVVDAPGVKVEASKDGTTVDAPGVNVNVEKK